MKIFIISPGKKHDLEFADAISEYEKRLSKHLPVEWVFPKASDKEKEADAILKAIKDDDFVVLLDERGKEIDSFDFSKLIARLEQNSTKRVVFIIGGAFGVTADVHARTDFTLKLSSLVFPHMLVRLILVEQLYRASSILSGGKYHHA